MVLTGRITFWGLTFSSITQKLGPKSKIATDKVLIFLFGRGSRFQIQFRYSREKVDFCTRTYIYQES